MHLGVVRELANAIACPLLIIFKRSWRSGEVPEDCKKTIVTPIFKKGKNKDSVNYRLVSPTLSPGKVMEQTILEIISKHMKDKKVIGSRQHGFMKRKSCFIVT
ncbi:hypothetical protein QYF61_006697 [Mycteria americana]|uniref:Reverse transcriptase domain-containing protein n=1 Tax=Mycteria americana TaxID=33587 RepID=A0AAN7S2Q8_MYCAM|nr:hypothetical protein QYF61_006697 [Mycteria americana]